MCNFSIPFSGDATALVSRAKTEITRAGGTFDGTHTGGSFMGKTPLGTIQGSYVVQGQEIVLSITKKPFLLSCKRIQKELSQVMV